MLLNASERGKGGALFTVGILSNIAYQLVASIFVVVTGADLTKDFLPFFLVQVGLPAAVFLGVWLFVRSTARQNGMLQRSVWNWRRPRLPDMLIAAGLGICVCFSSGFLNEVFSAALRAVGIENGLSFPEAGSAAELVLFLVVLCVLPAFSEEMMFRGALTSFFARSKAIHCCLISGGLFALMHMNVSQVLNAFLVGMLLTLITLRTGSVFPAMLLHFVNNLATVVRDLVNQALNPTLVFLNFSVFDLVMAGVCALLVGAAAVWYARQKTRAGVEYAGAPLPVGSASDGLIPALPGAVGALIFLVVGLI